MGEAEMGVKGDSPKLGWHGCPCLALDLGAATDEGGVMFKIHLCSDFSVMQSSASAWPEQVFMSKIVLFTSNRLRFNPLKGRDVSWLHLAIQV